MRPTDDHIIKQIKQLKPNISGQTDQRILSNCFALMDDPTFSAQTARPNPWRTIMKNKITYTAAAASFLLIAGLLIWPGNSQKGISTLTLLSQAHAAEQNIFAGQDIVYLVNEFTLTSAAESTKFSNRLEELENALAKNDMEKADTKNIEALEAWFSYSWLPFYYLENDGQLKCVKVEPAGMNSCVVTEKIWYDPATGRFARILETDGKVIFANSFDGRNICTSYDNAGILNVRREAAATGFDIPENPADFLGMGVGITDSLSHKENYPPIISVTEESLDQTPVRVYKLGFKDIKGGAATYYLFKVGIEDNIIYEIQCVVEDNPSMVLKRISTQSVPQAALSWDLHELDTRNTPSVSPSVLVRMDMFSTDISVAQMVNKADFETYIFSSKPGWTAEGQISSGPDEGSGTSLMFNAIYPAKDGRHVILSQMQSLTRYHSGILRKMEETGHTWPTSYTSPNGCKMYRGDEKSEKWWTEFAIKASGFDPSENRCGVIIQTPDNTFLALAINGPVSEQELHSLVDSLIPARQYSNH